MTLLFTSYLVITALAMLITGWVSTRIGAKKTLLVGLALSWATRRCPWASTPSSWAWCSPGGGCSSGLLRVRCAQAAGPLMEASASRELWRTVGCDVVIVNPASAREELVATAG